jgi:hypothetical protein
MSASCGKVRHGPALESLEITSEENSYCIVCSRYQYGQYVDVCPHCGAQIVSRPSYTALLRMTKYGGSELL